MLKNLMFKKKKWKKNLKNKKIQVTLLPEEEEP
jgi:hypothetical protein